MPILQYQRSLRKRNKNEGRFCAWKRKAKIREKMTEAENKEGNDAKDNEEKLDEMNTNGDYYFKYK